MEGRQRDGHRHKPIPSPPPRPPWTWCILSILRSIHSCIPGIQLPLSSTLAASPWQPLTISSLRLSSFATAVVLPPTPVSFTAAAQRRRGGERKSALSPPAERSCKGKGLGTKSCRGWTDGWRWRGGVETEAQRILPAAAQPGEGIWGGEGWASPSSSFLLPPSLALLQFSFRLPSSSPPSFSYGSPAAWQSLHLFHTSLLSPPIPLSPPQAFASP